MCLHLLLIILWNEKKSETFVHKIGGQVANCVVIFGVILYAQLFWAVIVLFYFWGVRTRFKCNRKLFKLLKIRFRKIVIMSWFYTIGLLSTSLSWLVLVTVCNPGVVAFSPVSMYYYIPSPFSALCVCVCVWLITECIGKGGKREEKK